MKTSKLASDANRSGGADQTCNPRTKPSPRTVADLFVNQFYQVLSNCPRYLYRFYDTTSTLTISETLEDGTQVVMTAATQEEIEEKASQFFPEARVHLEVVCPQLSTDDGIVVLVTGELARRGKPDCMFAQSFFLAVQKKGYFVLNDILRIFPLNRGKTSAAVDARNGKEMDAPPNAIEANQLMADPLPTPRTPAREDRSPLSSTEAKHAGALVKQSRDVDKAHVNAKSVNAAVALGAGVTAHRIPSLGRQQEQIPDPLEDSDSAGNSETGASVLRTSSIFVRAIPEDTDEQALLQAFRQYGRVREGGVTIKQGRRDRFAFVDFDSANVDAVLDGRVKIYVQGQPVMVEEKRPIVIRRPARGRKSLSFHGRHPRECSASASGAYNQMANPHFFHHDQMPQQPPVYTAPI